MATRANTRELIFSLSGMLLFKSSSEPLTLTVVLAGKGLVLNIESVRVAGWFYARGISGRSTA